MSTPVNFSSLQLTTTAASTDRLLLNVSTVLSGVDAFNQISVGGLERSLTIYSIVSSQSANNASVYSTVQANSATNWNYQGTDIKALTGNWQSTYSTVSANSATWSNGFTIFRQISSTAAPNNTTTVHALSIISLSANVDVAIIAKGTGATLAQIPNSATSGGNKRGIYATDLQKQRNQSFEVASGSNSTIGGGSGNTASGNHAVVAGGQGNNAGNSHATIAGGYINSVGGAYATIAGGYNNLANGSYAVLAGGTNNASGNSHTAVGGGSSNNASVAYATIGGGLGNSAAGYGATIAGGTNNYAGQTYTTIPGGYGARTWNHGQYAYASHFFANYGDGQHFQYVLYGTSVNGSAVVLTTNCANYATDSTSIPSLFVPGQDMAAILTVQVIGFDDSSNCSHSLTKLVVRKLAINNFNEELLINTTIGTDGTGAGAVAFAINTNAYPEHVLTVTGSSNGSDNTRWVAHVSGTWVHVPPAYP